MYSDKQLRQIAEEFAINKDIISISPLGSGLINDTFKVKTGDKNYVLQHINKAIFPNVDLLQQNIENVTEHIRNKLIEAGEDNIDNKVLSFVKSSKVSTDGRQLSYIEDENGEFWRLSHYIEDSVTYNLVNTTYSKDAGEAFGHFEAMLVDLKKPIGEVIPNFHNLIFRLSQLDDAIKNDPVGRLKEVQDLVDLVNKHADEMTVAERLYQKGQLPKRICHCDTKVNNVLFDKNGHVLCVIDLDTVMPSFIFSDFGDFLRTAANTVAEDDPHFEKIDFRMDIFKAFTEGYLKSARSFLLPIEIEHLPYAARLFAFMQSVRFLADYINGDVYYKTTYPEHNKVRARNQMTLFLKASEKEKEMRQFISF
mgnify:CR=1 FL=1